MRTRALAGLIVALMAMIVMQGPAAAKAERVRLTWTPRTWATEQPAGTVSTATIAFTYAGPDVKDPQVVVRGPAAAAVEADVDGMRPDGDGYVLPVTVTVRSDTAVPRLEGSLRLRDGGKPVGPALPIRIIVNDPTKGIPTSPQQPSPDRVVEEATGVLVVRDELAIGVDFDHPNPDAVARAVADATGGVIIGASPRVRLYQIWYEGRTLEETKTLESVAEDIDGVAFASLNVVDAEVEAVPDDSEWDSWATDNRARDNNWGLKAIDAVTAWDSVTGASDLRIGVIDADNDEDHGDLDDNVVNTARGPSLSGGLRGHGTHVAGTACAEGDNGKGISGVMWDCELRFYAAGDAVTTADLMGRAVDDANRVVNMSLNYIDNGDTNPTTPKRIERARETNDIFGQAVVYGQREREQPPLWVIAAGNDAQRDVEHTAPGGLATRFPTDVIAVAAIGRDGALADFSNVGDAVTVAAPGVDIYSTLPRTGCWIFTLGCNDDYGFKNGTSMATPHVTGLAGLVFADDPTRSAADVKRCIESAAERDGDPVPGQDFHVIDAPAAVACEGIVDLPDTVDIVLALDLTGSMGGELDQAKAETQAAIDAINAAAPGSDIRYSVVSYMDYPGAFDSRSCGSSYSSTYGSASAGDVPFRIDAASSDDGAAIQAAIRSLELGSGEDGPESYARALWETAQPDTQAALGLRTDALKLVVNIADNLPHDTNLNEGIDGRSGVRDTGRDPGRDNAVCTDDDIDFQDGALAAMRDNDVRLLHVDASGGTYEDYWRTWASITGGSYTQLRGDRALGDVILELLELL